MRENFGELLESFRLQVGLSRNQLAIRTGIDASYATRICHGDRDAPRIHVVEAMARALNLSLADRNRFLVAAGYAPVELGMVPWAGALQAVADVLSDPFLSIEDRDAFEATVRNIALRWRGTQVPARVTNGAHP